MLYLVASFEYEHTASEFAKFAAAYFSPVKVSREWGCQYQCHIEAQAGDPMIDILRAAGLAYSRGYTCGYWTDRKGGAL